MGPGIIRKCRRKTEAVWWGHGLAAAVEAAADRGGPRNRLPGGLRVCHKFPLSSSAKGTSFCSRSDLSACHGAIVYAIKKLCFRQRLIRLLLLCRTCHGTQRAPSARPGGRISGRSPSSETITALSLPQSSSEPSKRGPALTTY